MNYPKTRKLDGIFFRVKRNDKWQDVCLTDLTETEQHEVLAKYDKDALLRVLDYMQKTMHKIASAVLDKQSIRAVTMESIRHVRNIADICDIQGYDEEEDDE